MEWRDAFYAAAGFTGANIVAMIVAIYHEATLAAATHAGMLPVLLAAVAFMKVREIHTATSMSDTDWEPGGKR